MKIPKNQKIALTYLKNGVEAYVVTVNQTSDTYTLFEVTGKNKELNKLKTANSPLKFKEVYPD